MSSLRDFDLAATACTLWLLTFISWGTPEFSELAGFLLAVHRSTAIICAVSAELLV